MQLSIVIPCYNAAGYVGRCLNSIIPQVREGETEIIAVDDGSRDNTLAILREEEKRHPFIKVLSQRNAGPSVARNNGVKEAKGKYIWFVDADDCIEPGAIDILSASMEKDPDVIAFNLKENYENGQKFPKVYRDEAMSAAKLISLGSLYACNRVFRRSLFEKVQLPEGFINVEDFVFNLSVSPYVNKVLTLDNVLYFYEKTNENATTRNLNKRHLIRIYNDRIRAHALLLERMKEIEDPDLKRSWDMALNKNFSGCMISLLRSYNCRMVRNAVEMYKGWGVYPFKYAGSRKMKIFTFLINHKILWIFHPLLKRFLF